MKRLLTLAVAALLTGTALAQIPNASFENWTTVGSGSSTYHEPTSWGTLNSTTISFGAITCDSSQVAAPDSTAYIKLTSKTTLLGVIPGIVVTGTINVSLSATPTYSVTGGFANTTRPANLAGMWKHMAMGSDKGAMGAMLWKWNATTHARDTVAIASASLTDMAMSWTAFTIPFVYKSGVFPDSAIILMASSASQSGAADGSYLYVDKLSFGGTVASVNPLSTTISAAALYPNPASNAVTVTYQSLNGGAMQLSMVDVAGRTIKTVAATTVKGENNMAIDLHGIARGLYIIKLSDESGIIERKLIVE